MDEDEVWDGVDLNPCIPEKQPRAALLPASIRYRTFSGTLADEGVDAVDGSGTECGYWPQKRGRHDGWYGAPSGTASASTFAIPLLKQLHSDPFAVAQRQHTTHMWLSQPRSDREITSRFALDRNLGATPALAAVNRAIRVLGKEPRYWAGVLDTVEEALLDRGALLLSTLQAAVEALWDRHPSRAARLALALTPAPHDADGSLPASTWVELAGRLAVMSDSLPRPLDDHFIDLFERVLLTARAHGGELSEAPIVAFGRCLLSSSKPLTTAVHLVQVELLSGRNRGGGDAHSALQLGAFISDLLGTLCAAALADSYTSTKADMILSTEELLIFASDVVKYAYARKVHLTPRAFDLTLALCDATKSYHRLCVLFCAMCAASVPTLVSLLRVMEVSAAAPGLLEPIAGRPPGAFLAWCVRRFPSVVAVHTPAERACLSKACWMLARTLAEEGDYVGQFPTLVTLMASTCQEPRMVAQLVSGYAQRMRECGHVLTSSPAATSLHRVDEIATWSLLFLELTSVASAALQEDLPLSVESTIATLLTAAPGLYCNVITAGVMSLLATNAAAEAAFVRMMDGYVRKTGALALLLAETLLLPEDGDVRTHNEEEDCTISEDGRRLVQRWRLHHTAWFRVLPLSISLQLPGKAGARTSVGWELFLKIRATGHEKVAYITNSGADAAAAKEHRVQPSIVLSELLKKLGALA